MAEPLSSDELLSLAWRRVLFLVAFAVAVILPVILVIFDKTQGAWITVLAGAAGMLLTRLEDIESFAIGPLSAKLRETITSAVATVEQVRQLAKVIATPALNSLVTPRFNRKPALQQYILRDGIVRQLTELKSTAAEIEEFERQWFLGAVMDHIDESFERFRRRSTDQKVRETIEARLGECRAVANRDPQQDMSDAMNDLLRELMIDDIATVEAIKDLSHFQRTRTLRRPGVFPGLG